MKIYPGMRKRYYQNKWNRATGQQEADRLRAQYGAICLDYRVGDSPAFILYSDELMQRITRINRLDKLIFHQASTLPHPFMQLFFERSIIEEVLQTNETEGIHSTHKEIRESMEDIERGRRGRRFDGMIRKYQLLIQQDAFPLESCQNVRDLYNEFVLDEVIKEDPSNAPDGQIFRKGTVNVQDRHGQFIHEGLFPESAIMEAMTSALAFLNHEDYDPLIRLAAFHFLFASIHPFYDGNGRMARFISSAKLKEYGLHPLVVFRLSYTIKERRGEYYRLFKDTEDWRNFGDLTQFVTVFLDFILQSAAEVLDYLCRQNEQFSHYQGIIRQSSYSQNAKPLLELLVQNALCGDEGLGVDALSELLGISIYRTSKLLKELSGVLLINKEGNRNLYLADLERLDQQ